VVDRGNIAGPFRTLDPLLLQHAVGEKSTHHRNSVELASALAPLDRGSSLCSVLDSDQLAAGAQFDAAVVRDLAFFRSLLTSDGSR
jgi:hypothetical protein